jgi:drug/metabolite transporter (DMT)-like permease
LRPAARLPVAVAVTIAFGSSAYAGISAALESYAPGSLSLLRMAAASVVLALWAAVSRVRLPDVRDLSAVAFAGLLAFGLYNVTLSYGQQTTTADSASLLIASIPLVTVLLAAAFLRERLYARGWTGILVGFFGVALISFGEGGGIGLDPGALLVLLAAASASVYFTFQKPYLEKYGSLAFTAYAVWAGTLW